MSVPSTSSEIDRDCAPVKNLQNLPRASLKKLTKVTEKNLSLGFLILHHSSFLSMVNLGSAHAVGRRNRFNFRFDRLDDFSRDPRVTFHFLYFIENESN